VGGARRSRGSPADLQDLSFELLRPICRADLISPLRHYLTSERGEGVKFVKDCNRKKKKTHDTFYDDTLKCYRLE
jgi:hypothetical protein